MSDLYTQLQQNLPDVAIEKTSGRQTGKGYDTTGYGYQYVIDQLNEVCDIDGWKYDWEIVSDIQGEWTGGKPYFEISVKVTIAIKVNEEWVERACAGGHRADMHGDALKGAITNGFKKTAAFFGVGAKAYRGTIDDDNQPIPQGNKRSQESAPEQDAGEFDRDLELPFGKHKGTMLHEIPEDYLGWVAENAQSDKWQQYAQQELDIRQEQQEAGGDLPI